jgi:MFS family permease
VDGAAVESAPGRARALGLIVVALVLAMTTWFSASAVVPQLREEWSLSNSSAAWLTIAVQLGFVAGALLSSALNLADLLPIRALILTSCIGAAVANLAVVAADGPRSAIPLRMLTGFFLAGVYPPAAKLISTWFVARRGTALGITVGALTLGSAVPHLVNGLGGLDWPLVIVATSAFTLLGGLAALAVDEGPHRFPAAVLDVRQIGQVFSNRGVRLASLGYFGHMWELYAMWAWFLIFYREEVAAGTSASYAAFAAIGVGALGCYAGGVLGDRIGRAQSAAAMMAISGTCALVIGLLLDAPNWLVLAVGLLWGFTVVADSAQFSTLVTEHADQAYVGTALSVQMAVGFGLTIVTIWLVPFLADAVGWRYAFAFLAPGPALGLLAMVRLARPTSGGTLGSGSAATA